MAVDSNHQTYSSADGITLQSLESKAETAKLLNPAWPWREREPSGSRASTVRFLNCT